MQAILKVLSERSLGTISPLLYGLRGADSFKNDTPLMWVGPDSSIPNLEGVRKETVELLRLLAPGFLSGIGAEWYCWQDGIGPREKRPVRVSYWGRSAFEASNMEWRNDFGTDEFVRLCRMIGAEPLMLVNEEDPVGSREWVEYCNYNGDSHCTRLRRANGNPQPHNVKYWNMYGWLDMAPEEYAASYRRFAAPVRALDPTVKLIAAGSGDEWNKRFFAKLHRAMSPNIGASDLVDYLGQIWYTGQHIPDVEYSDEQYYRVMHNCAGIEGSIAGRDRFLAEYDKSRRPWGIEWLKIPDIGTPTIRIAALEWGTVHFMEHQTMREAIAHASILDIFHRWARRVSMASVFLNMVIQSKADRLFRTPTYHVFDLYRPHRGNQAVAVEMDCPVLKEKDIACPEDSMGSGGTTAGSSVMDLPDLPLLSASGSVAPDGSFAVISVTNRHLARPVEIKIELSGRGKARSAEMRSLTAANVRDFNDAEHPDCVRPQVAQAQIGRNGITAVLKPFSVNVLKVKF